MVLLVIAGASDGSDAYLWLAADERYSQGETGGCKGSWWDGCYLCKLGRGWDVSGVHQRGTLGEEGCQGGVCPVELVDGWLDFVFLFIPNSFQQDTPRAASECN